MQLVEQGLDAGIVHAVLRTVVAE
jgi:hypothetical protein